MSQKASTEFTVGIDVAKDKVDVCILDQDENVVKAECYPQDKYPALVKNLLKRKPGIIVLEATGGYERELALLIARKNLPLRILNPMRVRKFASAIGWLCKTDRVDAKLLAIYAKRNRIAAAPMPSEKQLSLRELVDRRRQLVDMRAVEKTRMQQTAHQAACDSIQTLIAHLNKQIADIDGKLDAFIDSEPEFKEKEVLLTSIPGVGNTTARSILSQMPELGQINRQSIAALAGVAPYKNESGQYRGLSVIRGGRIQARNALYMATVSAIKHNPRIKQFSERLTAEGKKAKVMITACMRKLLLQMNAVLKKKTPYFA